MLLQQATWGHGLWLPAAWSFRIGVKVLLFPSSLTCFFWFPLKAFRTIEFVVYVYIYMIY